MPLDDDQPGRRRPAHRSDRTAAVHVHKAHPTRRRARRRIERCGRGPAMGRLRGCRGVPRALGADVGVLPRRRAGARQRHRRGRRAVAVRTHRHHAGRTTDVRELAVPCTAPGTSSAGHAAMAPTISSRPRCRPAPHWHVGAIESVRPPESPRRSPAAGQRGSYADITSAWPSGSMRRGRPDPHRAARMQLADELPAPRGALRARSSRLTDRAREQRSSATCRPPPSSSPASRTVRAETQDRAAPVRRIVDEDGESIGDEVVGDALHRLPTDPEPTAAAGTSTPRPTRR